MKKIYICGPTVYDEIHIGNLRPILTFDIYARTLKALHKKVYLSHNITDIDDKIITKAANENTSEKIIATNYLTHYNELLEILNVSSINNSPLVSDNIKIIINFIKKLISLDIAYEVNGNIFFDISKAKYYGNVSNQNTSKLINNQKNELKKNVFDFALWKKTNKGIAFKSPWGIGRPGWHTECAALIDDIYNGVPLDIHSGGSDLIFPHHENEDAQFRALHGKSITKEWKHVGQINLNNMKMSKSLGNIINANNFIEKHGVDTLRMIFLSTSVTNPININDELIESAKNNVKKIKSAYIKAKLIGVKEKENIIALNFILHWQFAKFNKDFTKKIKNFNNDNNSKKAGEIIFITKVLGFNFSKIMISIKDKNLYYDWINYREKKDYRSADKIRKILIKKELI